MTEYTSASKELLSQLPTNITIKSSISVKASSGESLKSANPSIAESLSSVHASNAQPYSPFNTSAEESSRSVNASTAESLNSGIFSTTESIQPPKPRTLSNANLPAGISVSSVACDSLKNSSALESKNLINGVLSVMDKFGGKDENEERKLKKMREESLSSINPSIAESTRPSKFRTLSINNLPPGISVSPVSCDSITSTKSQSGDFLSAMDKFVRDDAKEEDKMEKMRDSEQLLDRRISNEDSVLAKADISFLASQVLRDANHKLNMIANISVSLESESMSADKNTTKRKRYGDSNEDNIDIFNGKRYRNSDFDDLPIIKDADNIEIDNHEMRC